MVRSGERVDLAVVVLAYSARALMSIGCEHFGVTLPWDEWEGNMQRIRALGVGFLSEPIVLLKGSRQEQAKFYLTDPSNNVIEVKAYRDVVGTLGLEP